MEIFKQIQGYEKLYCSSNLGNIKSLRSNKILKPRFSKGYCRVVLYKNKEKKNYSIHQLVAIAFLNHKICGHKIIVDHIDNDRTNNNLDNLRLITNRENCGKRNLNYTSKYVGVSWDKVNKKWICQIRINGIAKKLGRFETELEASNKYQEALNKLKL